MDKELFIAICDRLEARVPDLRWVDAEDGQLSSSDRPAVAFPCALVDIAYVDCKTLTGGTQRVKANITLRVAFNSSGHSDTSAPDAVRRRALSRFDTLDAVHNSLQWWGGNGLFNPLRRLRCVPERHPGALKVYCAVYETEFTD